MWSNKYVNIPFADGGRDISGCDCWGLVRLVYQQEFGIDLPSFSGEYDVNDPQLLHDLIAQYKESWETLAEPEPGCVVLFRMFGSESHIGVAVSATQFLHAREKYASAVENFSSTEWNHRIVGYYKYREKTGAMLHAVPHPLRTNRVVMQVVPGSTLALVYETINEQWQVSDKLKKHVTILLNGRVVPKESWATTVVSDTDTIEYRAVPGRDAVRLVLTVIVAVVAMKVGLAAAGLSGVGALGTASATQIATFAVASTAVTIAGTYLVNVIAPIRPPDQPSGQDSSSTAQLLLQGNQNSANRYGAIPVILGRMRITPPLAAQNYARFTGTPDSAGIVANASESYLDMLLAWGYGPLEIDDSSLRVGQIPLINYEGDAPNNEVRRVTLDRKTEPSADDLARFNGIYGRDVQQVYSGLTLSCPGPNFTDGLPPAREGYPWTPQTTPGPWAELALTQPCEKFTVALHFPQGLRHVKVQGSGAGENRAAPVRFDFEYRVNDGNWQPWTTQTIGGTISGAATTTRNDITSVSDESGYYEYTTVVTVAGNLITGGEYIKDGFTWTITKERTWGVNDTVQVRVRRSTGDGAEPHPDYRYTHTAILQTLTGYSNANPATDPPNSKIAKTALTIKASKQLNGQIEGINALVQTWCREWNGSTWNNYAATSNPASLFLYVLTHPGNPQRVLEADIATKIDLAKLQYWHAYCNTQRNIVLNGTSYTYKFEFNSVLGDQRSVLDVLRDICAAGRASPAMVDGRWSVVIDEPKPMIVQHFTPHNSWGFESVRGLPRLPDALKIQYYDELQDYQTSEIIVSYADKDVNTAELFESISLPGVTNKGAAADHARWHLAQAKLRREVYTLNTDIEYIVCNRGDRVKVMHDVPMWGLGSGRIKNRVSNTILDLDEDVPLDNAKSYSLRIRGSQGQSTELTVKTSFAAATLSRSNNVATVTLAAPHPIQAGDRVTVNLSGNASANSTTVEVIETSVSAIKFASTGVAIASTTVGGTVSLQDGYYTRLQTTTTTTEAQASPGDLFIYGEYQTEAQDLLVISIEPTGNKSAKLTLVDYGVTDTYNIFTDYRSLSSSTIFETQITLPPQLLINSFGDKVPAITSLTSDVTAMEEIAPGIYRYSIKASFTNALDLPSTAASVEAQILLKNAIDTTGIRSVITPLESCALTFNNVDVQKVYKIRLRYVGKDGRTGQWTEYQEHTVVGKLLNYQLVDQITVVRSKRNLIITPYIAIVPNDFKSFEVRVWKDSGTGDFWDNTDPESGIKSYAGIGAITIDLRDFASPRLSEAGVQYRVACRVLDNAGNYSNTSTLGAITIKTISP
jgi:hypothetical protein